MSALPFRVAAAIVALAGACSAQAQGNYERLSSQFLGGSMSLDVGDTGRTDIQRTTMMLPTGNAQGQLWLATPMPGGHFQMTNAWTGRGQCLDVAQGGVLYFDTCGNQIGQRWRIQPVGNGRVRFMNDLAPGQCLDVANDPNAYLVYLTACSNAIGQIWSATDTGIRP